MLSGLSLRARLVLGVIVLAGIGLLAADIATYSQLDSFLRQRTDRALQSAHIAVESTLRNSDHVDAGAIGASAPGDFVQLRQLDNTVLVSAAPPRFPDEHEQETPRLPRRITLDAQTTGGGGRPERTSYFTVPARGGEDDFRVRASVDPGSSYILVVSTSLHDVQATLDRLLWIELLVTAIVLAALGALGLWVVRLGLRPLEAIGSTAAAIAAGDLSRRVERAEERTEVGRLGLALNAMLSQIETAFRAQEASERKLRRFVADASHELRTPLSAVRAYAELFTRGADRRPDDLARSMAGITRESERMSLLVDDLLLLARLDEGRPLEREPVDVDEVVGEAVETAHAVDPDRPIDLRADHAVVLGDRHRLRQIVDNLLGNVRAHTPPGSPVHVSVSRANGNVLIEVADSGPGMSGDELERVFERFYRADPSRARASGGVGLGLSIVSAVAEAHGGTVSATSEPGKGSTFRITLPLAE